MTEGCSTHADADAGDDPALQAGAAEAPLVGRKGRPKEPEEEHDGQRHGPEHKHVPGGVEGAG